MPLASVPTFMQVLQWAVAIAIVAASGYAVARRVDVRLALLVGALALGLVAGKPIDVVRRFLESFTDYKFVVPIACAMGFGYVLQHTGCGAELARLLVKPFQRFPTLLLPGTVLIGFLVNVSVVSQSSAAATVGAVLIPVLLSAGLSPLNAGAALLIGCSIGGELLNPSGPEYATVIRESAKATGQVIHGAECVAAATPIVFANLVVATLVFWFFAARLERKRTDREERPKVAHGSTVNLLKAIVPIVPLVFLFLVAKPFQRISLPQEPGFMVSSLDTADIVPQKVASKIADLQDTRLIGFAMLLGVVVATLSCLTRKDDREKIGGIARAFFEGTGFAFANVISLIAVAACFAEGIKATGLGEIIGRFGTSVPGLLMPLASISALLFAILCGSGIAATQGLFGIFAGPAAHHGLDLTHVGVITSAGSAIGRTMSPVSAVGLMSAKLTSQDVVDLVRAVALPLLAGFAAGLAIALIR